MGRGPCGSCSSTRRTSCPVCLSTWPGASSPCTWVACSAGRLSFACASSGCSLHGECRRHTMCTHTQHVLCQTYYPHNHQTHSHSCHTADMPEPTNTSHTNTHATQQQMNANTTHKNTKHTHTTQHSKQILQPTHTKHTCTHATQHNCLTQHQTDLDSLHTANKCCTQHTLHT